MTPADAVILMYHRVDDLDLDPWELAVAPQHFDEHLAVLAAEFPVASLRDVADGTAPRGSVALTFDDGYADLLEEAVPLLVRHAVPATAFLVSGGFQRYWWDDLARVLLRPGDLPRTLRLGQDEWDLGADARYEPESFQRWSGWQPWGSDPPTARQATFLEVWQVLQRLSQADREDAMVDVRGWAHGTMFDDGADRVLTHEEVRELASCPMVEVGAHTVTHPALSALDHAAQRHEIADSKSVLEQLVDRPVSTFAYPYGRRQDFTEQTAALVREAGFDCACANVWGLVQNDTDRFALPRMHVGNWTGAEFRRRVTKALAGG